MRVLAVHEDAIVFVSRAWQTTCTALRGGEEGFLIDSPLFPDELEALPAVLEQAGFPVSALMATHADWDHVLGRLAFPSAALGVSEGSALRLRDEPGVAARKLREFDDEHYLERPRPLSLGSVQHLPVPGRLGLGPSGHEIELRWIPGHTGDGTAFWSEWMGLLIVGDYLSPVEIPMISAGGSVDAYLATLDHLEPLVRDASTVVPGHGAPLRPLDALTVLEADRVYLRDLMERGAEAALPRRGASRVQQRIHAENVKRVGAVA